MPAVFVGAKELKPLKRLSKRAWLNKCSAHPGNGPLYSQARGASSVPIQEDLPEQCPAHSRPTECLLLYQNAHSVPCKLDRNAGG